MASTLEKKLGVRAGVRVRWVDAPRGFTLALPEGARRVRGAADVLLVFVTSAEAVVAHVETVAEALERGAIVWIAYPKKGSGVVTDLHRDRGWAPLESRGFGRVSLVSIDEAWNALRFRREADVARKPGSSVAANAAPKAAAAPKPPPVAASDLRALLAKNPAASTSFLRLAPSHAREWIGWIEDAKRPETRARRLDETVRRLAAGERDRNAKYSR
jgi:hypothetical protein